MVSNIIENIDQILKTEEDLRKPINELSDFLEVYEKYQNKIDEVKKVLYFLKTVENRYKPLEFKLLQIGQYIRTYKNDGSKSSRMKHYLGLFIDPFEGHTDKELNEVYDYFNFINENRFTMEVIKNIYNEL